MFDNISIIQRHMEVSVFICMRVYHKYMYLIVRSFLE